MVILPGSNARITWTFDDDISKVDSRSWFFTSSNDSAKRTLAVILLTAAPVLFHESLPEFNIIPPGTLVLRNVNESYDGTYEFELNVNGQPVDTSTVGVFIASKVQLGNIYMFLSLKKLAFKRTFTVQSLLCYMTLDISDLVNM